MPMALRKILSPRFVRQSIDGWAARPFGRLVRQFLARTVSGSNASADSDLDLGIGGLLGLLATPGAFTCFLLLDKYSTFLNWYRGRRHIDIYLVSLSDKYLFIALAMAVTGIVTVLKWDKILPDSQDYLNLAPLPVRRRTILLANAAAIAIAVLVFAIDVNAVPSVLFPLFVSSSGEIGVADFLRFAGTHLTCVLMASFFSICAVFALLGTFAAVLPRQTFRAISSWLRGIMLLGLIALLLTGFAGPALVRHLEQVPASPVRCCLRCGSWACIKACNCATAPRSRTWPQRAGRNAGRVSADAGVLCRQLSQALRGHPGGRAPPRRSAPRAMDAEAARWVRAARCRVPASLPPFRGPRPVAQRTASPGDVRGVGLGLADGVARLARGRPADRRVPADPGHPPGLRTPGRRTRQLDVPGSAGPARQ